MVNFYSKKFSLFRRLVAFAIILSFFPSLIILPLEVDAQGISVGQAGILNLPAPGTMITHSQSYIPVNIRGIKIFPDNPLRFDFIVDKGNSVLGNESLREESSKLVKYFLASLTVPDEELWVNLSPYEKDRIMPLELGLTEMGRDLLAQDYILKQLTASMIYPDGEQGKEFWNKVYAKAEELYGTTEIPINTFHKVWIVPEMALIYVSDDIAFIVESHLKVMLEKDYLVPHEKRDFCFLFHHWFFDNFIQAGPGDFLRLFLLLAIDCGLISPNQRGY